MQRLITMLGALALAACAANSMAPDSVRSSPLSLATPQSAGFSRERLDRLDEFMRGEIAAGDYLGAVTLIARNGKIVEWRTYGHRDIAKQSPMERDSIFRIFSMTKTLASVAVLMLMEEGKLTLEDPIGKYLPEFSGTQVFAGGTAAAPQLRAPKRPITIRHLLTHISGFATSSKDPEEAVKILREAELNRSPDLKSFSQKLASLPLGAEPGERYSYDGVSTEVLARLIEVVSGKPFDVFMQERLIAPLRLEDTGFSVPAEKRVRIVEMTSTDADGKLTSLPVHGRWQPGDMLNAYPSGAGGLYSTAPDYARFCQMLLKGGELDGVSILGRKTVELMMLNHLTHLNPPVTEFSDAEGMGLGGYVVLDVARRGRPGSPGQFGWSGAASTYYTVDRQEQLIAILMMQHLPQGLPKDPPKISFRFYNLVYQALVD